MNDARLALWLAPLTDDQRARLAAVRDALAEAQTPLEVASLQAALAFAAAPADRPEGTDLPATAATHMPAALLAQVRLLVAEAAHDPATRAALASVVADAERVFPLASDLSDAQVTRAFAAADAAGGLPVRRPN